MTADLGWGLKIERVHSIHAENSWQEKFMVMSLYLYFCHCWFHSWWWCFCHSDDAYTYSDDVSKLGDDVSRHSDDISTHGDDIPLLTNNVSEVIITLIFACSVTQPGDGLSALGDDMFNLRKQRFKLQWQHLKKDLIVKHIVHRDKDVQQHTCMFNLDLNLKSLLQTESHATFMYSHICSHISYKHTHKQTAASQSLKAVCCLLSLILCLSLSKPITVFFLCCSQHTHTQEHTHTLVLSLRPYSISL